MSLYSDLTEVLTPYANKINELNGSLENLPVLTPTIKTALMNLLEHVAYSDDDGRTYYNLLYEAIYEDSAVEPVWSYSPSDGLLSEQSYVSDVTTNGNATETLSDDRLGLYAHKMASDSGNNTNKVVAFNDTYNGVYGRLSLNARARATMYYSRKGGDFRMEVGNETKAAQFFLTPNQSTACLDIKYYSGSTQNTLTTEYASEMYHDFDVVAIGNTAKLYIDGNLVVSAPMSETYVNGIRIMVISSNTKQDIVANIKSMKLYDTER